jgi:adenosylhomocysteine nucleosidase
VTVLVVFALDWEFTPWRHERAFTPRGQADGRVYEADIGAAHVVVGFAGVGARRLAALTATVFTRGLTACISSGLGGGLVPQLGVGDIVAAHRVRADTGDCAIESDACLVRLAERCGARTVERFVTSTRIVRTADEKIRAGAAGEVVEMEGAAVLREAGRRGVPAVAIRAIGDARDDTMPIDFNRVINADGGISLRRVAADLCRRPRSIPSMIRFGARNRAATERLADFLDRYVQGLGSCT